MYNSTDRSCTWGMIHSQIHFISPGCPWPSYSLTVQNRDLKHPKFSFLYSIQNIKILLFCVFITLHDDRKWLCSSIWMYLLFYFYSDFCYDDMCAEDSLNYINICIPIYICVLFVSASINQSIIYKQFIATKDIYERYTILKHNPAWRYEASVTYSLLLLLIREFLTDRVVTDY